VLIACLNGDRPPQAGVPVTPEQLGLAAEAAVNAGAGAVHVHPRGPLGAESLEPADVRAAVAAIRGHARHTRVGVTTREPACPDARRRVDLIRSWPGPAEGGPDFASVNWHEPGAGDIAFALRAKRIGVEAGIWTARSASAFVRTTWPRLVERVLVEVIPGVTPGASGVWAAERVLAALGMPSGPVLVHGEQAWAWPVLRWAQRRGYDVRIGLEDTLTDEHGRRTADNAALVRAALTAPRHGSADWPVPSPLGQRRVWDPQDS
jgi:uncharacterized protein (DUF849 family)